MIPQPPASTLFPYTTLFRSEHLPGAGLGLGDLAGLERELGVVELEPDLVGVERHALVEQPGDGDAEPRSEEHTSELQSRQYLECRLLLEKIQNWGARTELRN